MSRRIILSMLGAWILSSHLSAAQAESTILNKFALVESKSKANKADILDSVARANMEHLVSKTSRKIESLKSRRERYSNKLAICKNKKKVEHILCKIKSTEGRLKSYEDLLKSLSQMKVSMSKKQKK